MQSNYLVYEQPLNERIRGFLRLEHLFNQASFYISSTHHWDTRQAIAALMEIVNLLERTDLKTEALKSLERHHQTLKALLENPHINPDALTQVLNEMDLAADNLRDAPTKLWTPLIEDVFLSTIRQRTAIPGGMCSFDLPAFHAWLHLPVEERQLQMHTWLSCLAPLQEGIALILGLLRQSHGPQIVHAQHGRFEKNFNAGPACQLVRLSIDASLGAYPEISGGKHCIHVRFVNQPSTHQKPRAIDTDIPFELTCCAL